MGIELRNALEKSVGRPLPATLAWSYPTAKAIIEFLSASPHEKHTHAVVPEPKSSVSPNGLGTSISAIEDLSDDEALAALLEGRK